MFEQGLIEKCYEFYIGLLNLCVFGTTFSLLRREVDYLVLDDPKRLDDCREEVGGRWNLLFTWQNTGQVVNCLLCFGAGLTAFCLQKKKKKSGLQFFSLLIISSCIPNCRSDDFCHTSCCPRRTRFVVDKLLCHFNRNEDFIYIQILSEWSG